MISLISNEIIELYNSKKYSQAKLSKIYNLNKETIHTIIYNKKNNE